MMLLGRPYTDENGQVDNAYLEDLDPVRREKVMAWVKAVMKKRKTFNTHHTSYGLKHLLEEDIKIYLTNNQFKDAMNELGFLPKDPDALNWIYQIDEQWLKKQRLNKSWLRQ